MLGGAVAYAVGMDAWSSVVMAFGVAALVVVCRRLTVGFEPEWGTELRRRQAGARGDLQDLAWSMAGRDGRTDFTVRAIIGTISHNTISLSIVLLCKP